MSKLDIAGSLVISPLTVLLKSVYSPILQKRDLLMKCYNEGLYHITKEENIEDILKSSGYISSYGSKKVFMFAGIPTIEDVCINIPFETKLVALKIEPSYEQLTNLIFRSKDDQAIAHKGNMNLTDKQVNIVYLGLHEENGKLLYKPISKNEYDNYKPNFDNKIFQNSVVRQLKGYSLGLQKNWYYTINALKESLDQLNIEEHPELMGHRVK